MRSGFLALRCGGEVLALGRCFPRCEAAECNCAREQSKWQSGSALLPGPESNNQGFTMPLGGELAESVFASLGLGVSVGAIFILLTNMVVQRPHTASEGPRLTQ